MLFQSEMRGQSCENMVRNFKDLNSICFAPEILTDFISYEDGLEIRQKLLKDKVKS